MNRRQFLGGGLAVAGALLDGDLLETARQDLGVGAPPSAARTNQVLRERRVTSNVETVDEETVTLALDATESRSPFRVVVVRREYPTGSRLSTAVSEELRLSKDDGARKVTVEVPRKSEEPGPWFYETYARPGPDGERFGFLCESAPYRWTAGAVADPQAAARVAAAKPPADGPKFERRLDGNDYVLTFRWRDRESDVWRLDCRLRRSVHEAAVAAERGYVRTYEESLASPVVAELLRRFQTDARRVSRGRRGRDSDEGSPRDADGSVADDSAADDSTADDPAADGSVGQDSVADESNAATPFASLDPGRQFDLLVRFVQYVDYARDAQSLRAYDYHRTVEETLVAGVGDCKDRSYLLAGLLSAAFDCETALLFKSGHVLLGVDSADVPALPYEYDAVELGERSYVPIEPSLRVPVGDHTSKPFVAAYGDGAWQYHDTGALVGGADRVVESWIDFVS